MKSEVRMAPEHAAAEVSSHVMRGGYDAAPSIMERKHAETFRESEHPATTLRDFWTVLVELLVRLLVAFPTAA
jgi:hypothetical protein